MTTTTTDITLDTIVSALREAGISGHCLMSTMDDGPRVEAPGLAIHWDDQDPNNEGWWVREAVRFDPTTGAWDGVREDTLDTRGELAKLVDLAAERFRAMA